jgi:hypothetical protein
MVVALSAVRMWTAAGGEVMKEGCGRRRIDVRQRPAVCLQKMTEMRRGAQVAKCAGMAEPVSFERGGKPVYVRSAETCA